MDYIELTVDLSPRTPWSEILIAELADLGFESFVETPTGIQAYAQKTPDFIPEIWNQTTVFQSNEVEKTVKETLIPHQNWNALWEADFEPVLVDERLAIIAPFHDANSFGNREIITIQPQMSFGTGHHQTTYMMSQFVLDLQEMPSKVLDMGTGTGVLAILAEKKGAKSILAVDIESWSVENTIENANRNNCSYIQGLFGDIDAIHEENFGLILANINKNVLKSHLPHYFKLLTNNGLLCLSGFFESDADEIIQLAIEIGFESSELKTKETWAALQFKKIK